MTAYEGYFSAENEIEKEAFLSKHIKSIRDHFKDLSSKKYDTLYEINSPDYVLMFVPIEAALLIAFNIIFCLSESIEGNIVLVSTDIEKVNATRFHLCGDKKIKRIMF